MPSFPNRLRTKPVFKIAAIDDQEKFRPLPLPTGAYPYHFNIEKIKPGISHHKMVFQVCGDTGGILLPTFQHQVVREMTRQYTDAKSAENQPQFFFHLGDVVYNFGQAHEYEAQFFDPFKNYPAPVFAIPGNHDADVDPSDPVKPNSLDAFIKVFCDTEPGPIPFSGNSNFKSNTQPNIYWVLETPLANIIGLYSNVPRFGTISAGQKEWFIQELKDAGKIRNQKALIVCLHHSAYSADTNHGASLPMQNFLNSAFETANVYPDIVLSGHVHNYQRFNRQYTNGKIVPFVVAGAGGYAQLHTIAPPNDPAYPDDSQLFNGVTLEKYCDDAHGFLNINIEKDEQQFMLAASYYTIADAGNNDKPAILFDTFSIDLTRK